MTDPKATIERLVTKAGSLYSLPPVAMKVLELTESPKVDARALKQCVETDPALTVKLLRVVNSSLYGLSREVSDLNQALALLGIKPLKLLVLGFSLPPQLLGGMTGDVLQRYWRHTLVKAVAAREISEGFWDRPGDEAFLAGLLQDVGILVLIQELGDPYVRFLEKVLAKGGDLTALEIRSIGFKHTALSAGLLKHWRLPDSLTESVGSLELFDSPDFPNASASEQTRILYLAELVARFLARGDSGVLGDLLAAAETWRGVPEEQVDAMIAGLAKKVQQLADALSLEIQLESDYDDLLGRAHRQLVDVATQVAEDIVRDRYIDSASVEEAETLLAECQRLSETIVQTQAAGDGQVSDDRAEPVHSEVSVSRSSTPSAPATSGPVATSRAEAPAVGRSAFSTDEVDPGILGRLTATAAACRRNRCALSLLLAELDSAGELVVTHAPTGLAGLRTYLENACRELDPERGLCLPCGENGFVTILPGWERQPMVRLGQELLERFRQLGVNGRAVKPMVVSVSLGIATVALPPSNFAASAEELFRSARRCLNGARASGGGVLKSIEIY